MAFPARGSLRGVYFSRLLSNPIPRNYNCRGCLDNTPVPGVRMLTSVGVILLRGPDVFTPTQIHDEVRHGSLYPNMR